MQYVLFAVKNEQCTPCTCITVLHYELRNFLNGISIEPVNDHVISVLNNQFEKIIIIFLFPDNSSKVIRFNSMMRNASAHHQQLLFY